MPRGPCATRAQWCRVGNFEFTKRYRQYRICGTAKKKPKRYRIFTATGFLHSIILIFSSTSFLSHSDLKMASEDQISEVVSISDLSITSPSIPEASNSVTRKNRSWVRDHCRPPLPNEPTRKNKALLYYCTHCDSYSTTNTTSLGNHLQKIHDIHSFTSSQTNILSAQTVPSPSSSSSLTAASKHLQILYEQARSLNQTENFDIQILESQLQKERVQEAFVSLIVTNNLSLSLVESTEFQSFCKSLNPAVYSSNTLPRSHNTVSAWIEKIFYQKQELVQTLLETAITNIHLAVDIWTSPNNHLLLGICGHFIDSTGKYRALLLALRPVRGHSGEDQWRALQPTLQKLNLLRRIGAIVGDNSGTNDTLCRAIQSYLLQHQQIHWNPSHRRIRCQGHILNLVVQAFFFQSDEEVESMAAYDQQEENDIESFEANRKEIRGNFRTKYGALGKLHNIVVFIRASPQRTTYFLGDCASLRKIPLDNRTRWNSWFRMLQVALHPDVRPALEKFMKDHEEEFEKDLLNDSDWNLLRQSEEFLLIFSRVTLQLQGHNARLDKVVFEIDVIRRTFEKYLVSLFFNKSQLLSITL